MEKLGTDTPRRGRGYLRLLLAGLAAFVLLALALYGALQSGWARDFLIESAKSQIARRTNWSLETGMLHGTVPAHMRLDWLALRDAQGEWLRINDLSVDLNPWGLLFGRVDIESLAVRDAQLLRLPAAQIPAQHSALPRIPALPAWLMVNAFTADRLYILNPATGRNAAFSAEGRYQPSGADWMLALNLQGVEDTPGFAELSLDLRDGIPNLALDVQDAALLPELLAMQAPVTASAHGAMQGEKWEGGLRCASGDTPFVEAKLTLGAGGVLTLAAQGRVRPAASAHLSPHAPLFGEWVSFDLAAESDSERALNITRLSTDFTGGILAGAGAALQAKGRLDTAHAALALEADIQLADLAPMAAYLGDDLRGSLSARASLQADETGSSFSISLLPGDFVYRRIELAGAQAEVTLQPQVLAWPPLPAAWQLQARATARYPGLPLERPVTLASSGTVETNGALRMDNLALDDGNSAISAAGSLELAAQTGNLEGVLTIADLGGYGTVLGQPLTGQSEAQFSIRKRAETEGFDLEIVSKMIKISGFYEQYLSVFNGSCFFSLNARLSKDQYRATDFTLSLGPAHLSGSGLYTVENRQFTLNTAINMDSLLSLRGLLKREMDGRFDANLQLSGIPGDFALLADARIQNLNLPPLSGTSASMDLQLSGLPTAAQGTFSAKLDDPVYGFEAKAALKATPEAYTFKDFSLQSGPNLVRGDLRTRADLGEVQASLVGECPKLENFGVMLGLGLSGAATFDVEVDLAGEELKTRGKVSAEDLAASWAAAANLNADWDLRGSPGSPAGSLHATGSGVRAAGLDLAGVDLVASAEGSAVSASLKGEGLLAAVYPVRFDGEAVLHSAAQRFDVNKLSLALDGIDAELLEQTSIQRGEDGAFSASRVRMAIAEEGRLEAEGRWAAEEVEAALRLDAFPLRLMESFGAPALEGSAETALTLSGAPSNPVIQCEFALHEARSRMMQDQNVPPLDLSGEILYENGLLSASARGAAGELVDLAASGAFPLELRLAPMTARMLDSRALSGALDARVRLDYISYLTGSENQLLGGDLIARAQLGGAWEEPRLSGEVSSENARYENAITGTVLETVAFRAELDGDTLRLTQFDARDAQNGQVSGTGTLRLIPARKYPYDLAFTLTENQLLHRDDLKARVSGTAKVSGDFAACHVNGDLRVNHATLHPNPGASGMRYKPVEYREVNGTYRREENKPPLERRIPIHFDLRCDVPGQAYVRMPGLDSEWKGQLGIGGKLGGLRVSGVMQAVEGRFDFLGKRFQLRDSVITMNPDALYTPSLNVTAMTEAGDVQAGVHVQGPADGFEISFVSQPPLPEDEVLAQILFGRPVEDINPVQAIELARYAALLGGRTGLGILASSPELQVIDALAVKTGENLADTQVGFGTFLTDKLYVELLQGGVRTNANIEYRVTPSIKIKGSTSSEEKSSVGLFWKRDY